MHIRNDSSFFLTNKTGAPQGEELGLIRTICRKVLSIGLTTPSSRMVPVDKVPVLLVQHQVPDRSKIPLGGLVEYLASPREIPQESLELL
ncbi:hypothetical protein Tco_0391804, partial [Tanacetum coccineum]